MNAFIFRSRATALLAFFALVLGIFAGCNNTGFQVTKESAQKAGGYALSVAMIKPAVLEFSRDWKPTAVWLESLEGRYTPEELGKLEAAHSVISAAVETYAADISGSPANKIILDVLSFRSAMSEVRAAWGTAAAVVSAKVEKGEISPGRVAALNKLKASGESLSRLIAQLEELPAGGDVTPYIKTALELAETVAAISRAY